MIKEGQMIKEDFASPEEYGNYLCKRIKREEAGGMKKQEIQDAHIGKEFSVPREARYLQCVQM